MFLVLKMKYNLTWSATNVTAHYTHTLGSANGKSADICWQTAKLSTWQWLCCYFPVVPITFKYFSLLVLYHFIK